MTFGGYLQSRVRCLSCDGNSNTFDPFLDLSLEVKQADSVEKALLNFTTVDRLCGDNRYKCGHCSKLVNAEKSMKKYGKSITKKDNNHDGIVDELQRYFNRLSSVK